MSELASQLMIVSIHKRIELSHTVTHCKSLLQCLKQFSHTANGT